MEEFYTDPERELDVSRARPIGKLPAPPGEASSGQSRDPVQGVRYWPI